MCNIHNSFYFILYSYTIIITEVRQEAVQQALAALKNRPKPSLPMPSKRSSVLNRSPDRDRDDSGKLITFTSKSEKSYQTKRIKTKSDLIVTTRSVTLYPFIGHVFVYIFLLCFVTISCFVTVL